MRQTDNRKFIFLINPISGTRGKSSLQQLIAQKTSEKGIEYNILPTNAEGNYDFLRTVIEREGITDIDGTIVKLSKMVPVLQIEALGNTAEEVVKEAHRQLKLGLDPQKTVFKIPVSLEGVRACKLLRNDGLLVNVHLVYTLQQAYMAMHAGATYVCPLVGRSQDQGYDSIALVKSTPVTVGESCVNKGFSGGV